MARKRIAKTLEHILDNPIVSASLDRSRDIYALIDEVSGKWEVDLEKRTPAPAYVDGIDGEPIYQGTDFDLFTFLSSLAKRKAVINLPTYECIKAPRIRENETIVSGENRHGQVLGIVSNKKAHSFSVRIKDVNVIVEDGKKEEIGAFRNFMVVDYSGNFYDGWKTIEFSASDEEKRFFDEHNLWYMEGAVEFKYFVHPALALAFFGSRYLETKSLVRRASDEAKFYRELAKRLKARGINLPEEISGKGKHFKTETIGFEKPRDYLNLEAELYLPDFTGSYPIKGIDMDGNVEVYDDMPDRKKDLENVLRYAKKRSGDLTYGKGYLVKTPARAVELAFFLYGFENERAYGKEIKPPWPVPEFEGSDERILRLNPQVSLVYRIKKVRVRTRER